jgi:NitT/TauT family transport system ATP-binding protein
MTTVARVPQPAVSGPVVPTLAFDRVSRRFADGTVALDGVDLQLMPGEFVAVVGPSGCGKTTLLRIASGLEAPTGGSLRVATSKIGYVFQDPTLLPWRSVQANVELLCELGGVRKAERRRLAREALELVGLEGFARHLPHALSGGMRMRASLARSLTLRAGRDHPAAAQRRTAGAVHGAAVRGIVRYPFGP